MFGNELLIGSIRAQTNHLTQILNQIEEDDRWKDNVIYYVNEIRDVEKHLRKIRKTDFMPH